MQKKRRFDEMASTIISNQEENQKLASLFNLIELIFPPLGAIYDNREKPVVSQQQAFRTS